MSESTETTTVYAGLYRGTMRFTQRCGIITPETEFQGGLRYPKDVDPEDRPSRLFFGAQTGEGSMRRFAEAHIAGVAVEVEVVGYFKYRNDIHGEPYLDTSALFVEKLGIVG